MDSGLKLWGIMTSTAIVIGDDCPTLVRVAARLAKIVFGSRIQICGATANQVEMIAAFTALPDDGGRVILVGRLFSINATIFFPTKHGVFLEGQGCYATEIYLADNSDCNMVDFSPTGQTLFGGISKLFLNGNKGNQASGYGIYATNADGGLPADLNILDLMVSYTKESGFYLIESWGYHIINCLSEFCDGHGFYMNGQQNYVENFFSAYNDLDGYQLRGSYNHYTNLHSWKNHEDGIYVKGDYDSYQGIIVRDWGSKGATTYCGIDNDAGGDNCSFAGVMVHGTTNDFKSWIGIRIDGDNGAWAAVKVVGCTDDGIEINGGSNSVTGNCLGNATVGGANLDDNGANNNVAALISA